MAAAESLQRIVKGVRFAVPLVAGTILVLFSAWALVVLRSGESIGSGTFGDAFGAISGFSVALAACLAVWSVRLQQRDLADTRQELAEQTREQELQNQLLGLQAGVALLEVKRASWSVDYDIVVGRKSYQNPQQDPAELMESVVCRYFVRLEKWAQTCNEMLDEAARLEGAFSEATAPVEPDATPAATSSPVLPPWAVVASFVFAVVLFFSWGAYVASQGSLSVGSGQFGDAFGPLTGLFTAAAVLLSLRAILLQHEELQMTRNQMQHQTSAMYVHNVLTVAHLRAQLQSFLRGCLGELMELSMARSRPHIKADVVRPEYISAMRVLVDAHTKGQKHLSGTLAKVTAVAASHGPAESSGQSPA